MTVTDEQGRTHARALARDARTILPRPRCAGFGEILVARTRHRLARSACATFTTPRSRRSCRFCYENSPFYRRRFERLGLVPTDIRNADDLIAKWPVVTKTEMAEDALAHPPYGTYTAMTDEVWAQRGWMMFLTSGSHRRAAGVSLLAHRSRLLGLGQCARAPRDGFSQGRHDPDGHRLWPACVCLGRAAGADENGPADHSRRRHGCARARQCDPALQADDLSRPRRPMRCISAA